MTPKPKVNTTDTDGDGIIDINDSQPQVPNVTVANNGYIQSGPNAGQQILKPIVSNIQLPGVPRGVSPDEAKNWFKYLSSNNKSLYDQFVANAKALGIPGDSKTMQTLWNDAVDWTQAIGSNSTSPQQYFSVINPEAYQDISGNKYGTTQQYQKTVTEYSPSTAAQNVQQTFKGELGREATAGEATAYTQAVNKAASTSAAAFSGSTTTSPGADGKTISSTVGKQTTGFDPTEFSKNFARSMPDYAENYAARNFMSLIQQSLSDPNRIGKVV
jgi:hypothetical protein